MPSRNLTSEQIAEAIRAVGLEPELVDVQADTPLSSLLYSYVRFGIPVILLVYIAGKGGHAVTVTGYGIADRTPPVTEPFKNIPYLGRRLTQLFVHDDNIGPFAHLRIIPTPSNIEETFGQDAAEHFASAPYALEMEWRDEDGNPQTLCCAPHLAIIPVYPKIRLTYIALHGWLDRLASVLEEYASKLGIDPKELEWDVRIALSEDFKSELRDLPNSPAISSVLLRPYPRYIWRITIQMAHRKVADVTADATELEDAFPFLDAIYYDSTVGDELRRFFSLPDVRDAWRRVIGPRFIDFLATAGTIVQG